MNDRLTQLALLPPEPAPRYVVPVAELAEKRSLARATGRDARRARRKRRLEARRAALDEDGSERR